MVTIENKTGSDVVVFYSAENETFVSGTKYDVTKVKSVTTSNGLAKLLFYISNGDFEMSSNNTPLEFYFAEKSLTRINEAFKEEAILSKDVDVFEFTGNVLNVTKDEANVDFIINTVSDYTVIMPSLQDVGYLDVFSFKNLSNAESTGTFVPVVGQQIEGSNGFEFFGKGIISLKKVFNRNSGIDIWQVINGSNLKNSKGEGKTKVKTFTNETVIEVVHNLGYTPGTEVWVSDGQGGYSESNASVVHDIINKDKFTVSLHLAESGFILYV